MNKFIRLSLLFLLSAILASCSVFKAAPAKNSGFIKESNLMSDDARKRSPFQRGWASLKWKKNRDKYTKIIIPKINIDFNVNNEWWSKQTLKNKKNLLNDKKEIAKYFRDKLIESYTNDPNKRFKVVNVSGANTVILELAIIELVPTKVILNGLANILSFFIPGTSSLSSVGKGSIAIEGRLLDSNTREIFALFADREKDKSSFIISFSQYSWYRGSKKNINDWAAQFLALINAPLSTVVEDSSPFTLEVW